jgi:hypothetical protein
MRWSEPTHLPISICHANLLNAKLSFEFKAYLNVGGSCFRTRLGLNRITLRRNGALQQKSYAVTDCQSLRYLPGIGR